MKLSSYFFEDLAIKLLVSMGYGDGEVTQRTHDGGIDGIIREDKLGFGKIFIQAKRNNTDNAVQSPEMDAFIGAMTVRGVTKGLFITTSRFSAGATESARNRNIVLIDGQKLTELMIEYGVGVSPLQTYELKTIDTDFFNE